MKFLNASVKEVVNLIKGQKIVFFGAGSWIRTVNYTELMTLSEEFAYVIDNEPKEDIILGNRCLKVFNPSVVAKEKNCVIIITSPVFGYSMYKQLRDMNLSDDILCLSLPFISIYDNIEPTESLLHEVRNCTVQKIPKIIHSFWFSGDEKPESYQKCIDTWKPVLKDYEIIEWNQKNYDISKNAFLKRAIECKAWAFASDYARLDVLLQYGGIYLDMDVEVFQSFDDLLGNDAILAFSNNFQIDLAVMGSKKDNPLVAELKELYEMKELPASKQDFTQYFQPTFVKAKLAESGIKMTGELQMTKNATIFPRSFFMPQEHVLFFPFERKEYTYCNHLDNFGWSFSGENKKEKKIRDNRLLWEELNR